MTHIFSPTERRERINKARLMLIFTPQLVEDPMAVLQKAMDRVDVIQVRPKGIGEESQAPSSAAECETWCRKVLQCVAPLAANRPLVLVNDRVDVARSLMEEGLDGVHIGQNDTPWEVARGILGPDALIGLSTHNYVQVKDGSAADVDYLGFGPIFATSTKGLNTGNNSVPAWIAYRQSQKPVFPIGGLAAKNLWQLSPVGRAAVAAGIMCEQDPAQAADDIRAALTARGMDRRRQAPVQTSIET